jgi:hypothetical protein
MKALTIDKNSHTEFVDIPEAVCGDKMFLLMSSASASAAPI